ncbi:MAG: EAL domain-containing protein [Pseudomonadota bacterium]
MSGLETAPLRVIVIDVSLNHAEGLVNQLRSRGWRVKPLYLDEVSALTQRHLEAASAAWDLILMYEPSGAQLDVVSQLVDAAGVDVPVIGVVEQLDERLMTKALGLGIRDVVLGDHPDHMAAVVSREMSNLGHRRQGLVLQSRAQVLQDQCVTLLDAASDAVAYVCDGMHTFANRRYVELFGFTALTDMQGLPILDLIADTDASEFRRVLRSLNGDDVFVCEYQVRDADGREFPARFRISGAVYDAEACLQIVVEDQSEKQRLLRQLAKLRYKDGVTGTGSRNYFLECARRLLSDRTGFAVAQVELENFRLIRRNVGLSAGDGILRELAAAIREQLDPHDVIARVGDHSFALLFPDATESAARDRAELIREHIANLIFSADGRSIATTCSVGVVAREHDIEHSPEQLLFAADEASREAIHAGGNQVRVVKAASVETGTQKQARQLLSESLSKGGLRILYQPVVDLATSTDDGAPPEIVDVTAELPSTPMPEPLWDIVPDGDGARALDRWMIARVVAIARKAHRESENIRLMLRLSDGALSDEQVLVYLTQALREAKLPNHMLVIQCRARAALGSIKQTRSALSILRQLRCQTALYDVAEGHDYISALGNLPVDYIKLSPTLTTPAMLDHRAVVQLAETAAELGIQIIATGIEDGETLSGLWRRGIRFAQGAYIQEPAPDLATESLEAAD